MASRRDTTRVEKARGKAAPRVTKTSSERYPDWKVQLFRAGMAERRNSAVARIGGRAMRAPGA